MRAARTQIQIEYDHEDPAQSLAVSAAALLIVRRTHATLLWRVKGVYEEATSYPWPAALMERDWGAPLTPGLEVPAAGRGGVYGRTFTTGKLALDCGGFRATFNGVPLSVGSR